MRGERASDIVSGFMPRPLNDGLSREHFLKFWLKKDQTDWFSLKLVNGLGV